MFALICSMFASAQMFYLEPQIRTGAGISWSDGALGVAATMETRISHLLYINVGAFRSITEGELLAIEDKPETWAALRHGIWAAPAFRVPHRYNKKGLNWDALINVGFGVSISELAEQDDWLLMEPSAVGGLDVILFGDKVSAKIGAKVFTFNPYLPEFRSKHLLMRPQASFELGYKW